MGYLREVVEDDIDLLFQWANDKEVRKNSFSTQNISYENHMKWFREVLKKDSIIQFIFIHENQPIGQARITVYGTTAEIGYSICAEKRNMGFGKEMLALLILKIRQDFPNIKQLRAKVKQENAASQKVFSDLGFMMKSYNYEMEL